MLSGLKLFWGHKKGLRCQAGFCTQAYVSGKGSGVACARRRRIFRAGGNLGFEKSRNTRYNVIVVYES